MPTTLGPIDRIPSWLRHLVIVFGSVLLGALAQDIIVAGGVFDVSWLDSAKDSIDAAAVSTASAATVLWLTPLTRQYGVGSPKAE